MGKVIERVVHSSDQEFWDWRDWAKREGLIHRESYELYNGRPGNNNTVVKFEYTEKGGTI